MVVDALDAPDNAAAVPAEDDGGRAEDPHHDQDEQARPGGSPHSQDAAGTTGTGLPVSVLGVAVQVVLLF